MLTEARTQKKIIMKGYLVIILVFVFASCSNKKADYNNIALGTPKEKFLEENCKIVVKYSTIQPIRVFVDTFQAPCNVVICENSTSLSSSNEAFLCVTDKYMNYAYKQTILKGYSEAKIINRVKKE